MIRKLALIGIMIVVAAIALTMFKTKKAMNTQKFYNTDIEYSTSLSSLWSIFKAYIKDNRQHASPKAPIPVIPLSEPSLDAIVDDAVIRLGHSTVLLKLADKYVLLDPVFSERASPIQWMGPKRFHEPPISIEDLPPIDAVIISHDHYDHLDAGTIKLLAHKVSRFIVPKNVGKYLVGWGVDKRIIEELEWWQQTRAVPGIEITAAPAQHFSGRGLFDKDTTLWASWAIKTPTTSVFYSGDSGYFAGFKTIGEKLGPFDLTLIETGAYNALWTDIHMLPKESVNAHLDVEGKVMMPVHNSTFDLALHDWFEPLEEVSTHARENHVALCTPKIGEIISISSPAPTTQWWRAKR